MPLLGYTLPTLGNANATEDPLVRSALSEVKAEYNANIANMLGKYTPIWQGNIHIPGTIAAGTFFFGDAGTFGTSGVAFAQGPLSVPLSSANYAVTGYSTKLKLFLSWMTNNTAPAVTFTSGLYPITSTGNATSITLTLGTVISGSTIALGAPIASSNGVANGTDFTFPADGAYVPGVVNSGTTVAASLTILNLVLAYRHV